MPFIQVITTTETKEQAMAIARHLVEEKLAACVQICGPMESIYRWKGEIEMAREFLCLVHLLFLILILISLLIP